MFAQRRQQSSIAGPLHGLSWVSSHSRMCTFSPRSGWRKCKMYCSCWCWCIVVTRNSILKHIQNIVYFLIPQPAWQRDMATPSPWRWVWCHDVMQCYVTARCSALTRPSTRLMNDPLQSKFSELMSVITGWQGGHRTATRPQRKLQIVKFSNQGLTRTRAPLPQPTSTNTSTTPALATVLSAQDSLK